MSSASSPAAVPGFPASVRGGGTVHDPRSCETQRGDYILLANASPSKYTSFSNTKGFVFNCRKKNKPQNKKPVIPVIPVIYFHQVSVGTFHYFQIPHSDYICRTNSLRKSKWLFLHFSLSSSQLFRYFQVTDYNFHFQLGSSSVWHQCIFKMLSTRSTQCPVQRMFLRRETLPENVQRSFIPIWCFRPVVYRKWESRL